MYPSHFCWDLLARTHDTTEKVYDEMEEEEEVRKEKEWSKEDGRNGQTHALGVYLVRLYIYPQVIYDTLGDSGPRRVERGFLALLARRQSYRTKDDDNSLLLLFFAFCSHYSILEQFCLKFLLMPTLILRSYVIRVVFW